MEPGKQKLPKPELEFTTVVYIYMKDWRKEYVKKQSKMRLLACLEDGRLSFPLYSFGCMEEGCRYPQYLISRALQPPSLSQISDRRGQTDARQSRPGCVARGGRRWWSPCQAAGLPGSNAWPHMEMCGNQNWWRRFINSLKHSVVIKDDNSFSIEWLEVKSSFMRSFKSPNVWLRFSALPARLLGLLGVSQQLRGAEAQGDKKGETLHAVQGDVFRLKYRLQQTGQRLLGTMRNRAWLLWTHQASEELGECCHLLIDAMQRSAAQPPWAFVHNWLRFYHLPRENILPHSRSVTWTQKKQTTR